MPTYEYECLACKHRFERFQKFSEPPVAECPECGSAVRKVLFPAGIVFKGSGWYITDSRPSRGSENGASAASSTAGGAAEKKSEPASTSKPDAKSEASGSTGSAKTTDSPKPSTPSTPSSSTPAKA